MIWLSCDLEIVWWVYVPKNKSLPDERYQLLLATIEQKIEKWVIRLQNSGRAFSTNGGSESFAVVWISRNFLYKSVVQRRPEFCLSIGDYQDGWVELVSTLWPVFNQKQQQHPFHCLFSDIGRYNIIDVCLFVFTRPVGTRERLFFNTTSRLHS
jgi:hypothetical protein